MTRLCLLFAAAAVVAAPAFAANDTITIGMTVSRTGALNVDSMAQQRGAEMWRDEVNAAGGIKAGDKRYLVKFVTYDDQSIAARVQQLYMGLITKDKAQFLFGPYSSDLTAPAAAVAAQQSKVMLVTGGSETTPFLSGNKYLFQLPTPADRYLASTVLALASKNPHAKIALVYSDAAFPKMVMGAVKEIATLAGLQVVLDESYPSTVTDFGPIVRKIMSSNADAFLGGGHYSDGVALARQIYDQKSNLKWVSILVAPGNQQFADLGPAALGITTPSQWESHVAYKPQFGPTAARFAESFQAKYKAPADYHSASGFAGGLILQRAIEQADSVEPDKVATALDALNVTTFFGRTSFATEAARHGVQASHEMVLAQWQMMDGKLSREVVWPRAAQSANLSYPVPPAGR
jgi:branched-chain amino acid transport system substrate-binding protein